MRFELTHATPPSFYAHLSVIVAVDVSILEFELATKRSTTVAAVVTTHADFCETIYLFFWEDLNQINMIDD